MQLKSLIKSIDSSLPVDSEDFEVKGITSDSRKVQDGFIFVAVKGRDFDGHEFIQEAVQRGAKAIVVQDFENQVPNIKKITCIRVVNTREVLAELAAQFYGRPSLNLKVVGITGTNGKTTISYLIEAILKSAHHNPAIIGTINYRFNDRILNAKNTTPGPEEIQALLSLMQKGDVDYVVIEVSSHALDQDRVKAVNFSTAIFTNLTQEHLDYHCDLKSYFSAKSKLFKGLSKNDFAILNIDDAHSLELIKLTKACVVTYGISNYAEVTARDIKYTLEGTEFFLHLSSPLIDSGLNRGINRFKIETPLIGEHNIYNILAAVAFGLAQEIGPDIIGQAIRTFAGVPGRLERIPTKSDFSVFVDYAHTEDALRHVISSLRPLCKGRLCVVFGCGGNRDRTKRPQMGRAVFELADFAIITTDNPRNEDPKDIIDEIVSGINKQNFRVIIDRRQAIKEALSLAGKDGIILIAGKGHENYQTFKDKTIHFDDREVVREFT